MNIDLNKNSPDKTFKKPFSEGDVLYLQDIFLTPGVHQINVDSTAKGRSVICDVLDSLHYHQKAACLSLHDMPLRNGVFDIVRTLITDDYLVNSDDLTLFFLDRFYFDFLWIEESAALANSHWYEHFKQHLVDYNFNKSIPIIKILIKK